MHMVVSVGKLSTTIQQGIKSSQNQQLETERLHMTGKLIIARKRSITEFSTFGRDG